MIPFAFFQVSCSTNHTARSPMRTLFVFLSLCAVLPITASQANAEPLTIGESLLLESAVLGETRRINVYRPTYYGEPIPGDLPVMVMPDGGIHEDFLHIAGLIDVSVVNGTMRPFVLVGIENTQRRRDLTGPTVDPEDRKIAPQVGESAKFRAFIRMELLPMIEATYAVTEERAIIGESLAGLFVVETALLEPDLFDYYFAIDPSLWWNQYALVREIAPESLKTMTAAGKVISLSSGTQAEIAEATRELAEVLSRDAPASWTWNHTEFPEESHGTIYHPAALKALRAVLAPVDE